MLSTRWPFATARLGRGRRCGTTSGANRQRAPDKSAARLPLSIPSPRVALGHERNRESSMAVAGMIGAPSSEERPLELRTVTTTTAAALAIADMIGIGVFTSLGFQVLDIHSA